MASSSTTHFTTTIALYNQWATTYDSDGNVLQRLDNLAFDARVLPLLQRSQAEGAPRRLLELGCGTGRNTRKLKDLLPRGSTLFAIDISENMLAQARHSIVDSSSSADFRSMSAQIKWAQIDFQTQQAELDAFIEDGGSNRTVDAVVSTLVLEHVLPDQLFSVISRVLMASGWAWVTDMHPEMGDSRAGYRRREDGIKVSGVSYNHGVEETLVSARKFGLELEGILETKGVGVDEEAAVKEFGERARKWTCKQMLVGMLFKKV